MRLAKILVDKREHLAICQETGFITEEELNREFQSDRPEAMEPLLKTERLASWQRCMIP